MTKLLAKPKFSTQIMINDDGSYFIKIKDLEHLFSSNEKNVSSQLILFYLKAANLWTKKHTKNFKTFTKYQKKKFNRRKKLTSMICTSFLLSPPTVAVLFSVRWFAYILDIVSFMCTLRALLRCNNCSNQNWFAKIVSMKSS